jgi:hypothetical protein
MNRIQITMGILLWSCVVVGARANSPQPAADELREWIDHSGVYQVEAAFVAFEGKRVRLRRKDGREIATLIVRLSEADKSFLRRHAMADEAAAKSWRFLFTGPGEGLRAEYYRDTALDEIGLVRADGPLDFAYPQHTPPYIGGKPINQIRDGWYENFAVRWSGLLVPRYSERYTLTLEMDDGAALWLDDDLLIHNWHWKGNKEYTAHVDLVAGRPYPLRILYYNGPFGGGIKFRWLSKSQSNELVPRECLYLPAVAPRTKPPTDLAATLVDRLSVREIPLPAPVKCDPRLNKPTLFLCPLTQGGFRIGWTDAGNRAHLTALSAELEPQGKDVITEKVDLRGLTVDRDGRSTLLLANMPNRMWLMHLDAAGKLLWRKCLVGEKGREADQHFLDEHFSFTGRLAAAGNHVAAHFAHSWNTGKSGTHQGGYFAIVERGGRVVQEDQWTVSHSLDQRLLFHGGCWFTFSAGDCFPKGLYLQNRTLGFGRVVYPEPAEREAFGNCGGFANAHLGNLVPLAADLAATFITKRDGSPKLYFLRLAPDCTVVSEKHLADMPADEQIQVVKIAPYGECLLVAWREAEAETKLAIVDSDGRFSGEPQSVAHSLPVHDDLIVLPGGDVAWLTAKNGESAVRLVRITAMQRE